ncbi:hypothetical protein BKA58DRAFT_50911 [Alternaria rosae]|uniref:uncharacterized protein n=1 Tax=Alternaria rosae TaxID=1187941 RepID=UPI001E8EBD06|nr:uncharacterized protein BKA58DRAFT_50911 [Alternaria rosae]KAH6858946.1 hypothetical protein BKA58DRAFT_50911 [Alternaria rosae]
MQQVRGTSYEVFSTHLEALPTVSSEPVVGTLRKDLNISFAFTPSYLNTTVTAKKHFAAAQANTTEASPANEVSCDLSDQSSSSASLVIYTPPDSGTENDNMASTAGNKAASPSLPAGTGLEAGDMSFTITTTHSPKPVLQDPSAANISKREYIYFLPYPLPPNTEIPYSIHLPHKNPLNLPSHQFEPTSTLVLTSPNHTFVDVRIYKSFSKLNKNKNANTPSLLLSTESTNQGNSAHLDWAFAGTSTSVPVTPPPTGPQHGKSAKKVTNETWSNVTHSTWTHWLDSRFPVGHKDIPVDEGDMYPIAPGLTLEVGHGYHPALGAVKTHEEMWRDVDAESTEKSGSKTCIVMRCQHDGPGVRGVVVRLGQYCQGIVMWGDKVTVERWEWHNAKDNKDVVGGKTAKEEVNPWKRTVRVGDGFLPCGVTFRPEILSVGAVVKFQDFEWVVEECWEWK